MVSALEAARKAARKAIEKTYYTGLCSVVERRNVRDEQTKITHKSEVTVIENQPCKLSFEKLDATAQTETAASLTQGTKLFLPPNVEIKAGSKIIVEQDGVKNAYSASGVPAVYPTHQEIILALFERWA